MARAERPLLGLPSRTLAAFSEANPRHTFFVGMQGQGRDEGLLQALPTSIAGIVVHDYYVVEVRQIVSSCINAEGAERELHQLVSKIDLEAS